MGNNSTNIKKKIKHLSPQIIEHRHGSGPEGVSVWGEGEAIGVGQSGVRIGVLKTGKQKENAPDSHTPLQA